MKKFLVFVVLVVVILLGFFVVIPHFTASTKTSSQTQQLQLKNIGELATQECDVVQVEVGAMMVGRICNHHSEYRFNRGEEKGMFQFGGSTIVLIFEENSVVPDEDILANTASGYETVVKYGEKIGKKMICQDFPNL